MERENGNIGKRQLYHIFTNLNIYFHLFIFIIIIISEHSSFSESKLHRGINILKKERKKDKDMLFMCVSFQILK